MKPLTELLFSNTPDSPCVIVLGGGPSLMRYRDQIIHFSQHHRCIVLSANYEHDWLPSDYILYKARHKLNDAVNDPPKCKNLIIRREMSPVVERNLEKLAGYNFYCVCNPNAEKKIKPKPIEQEFTKDGRFLCGELGNAGFTALAVSAVFRPAKVLAVGFDGPEPCLTFKYDFQGQKIPHSEKQRHRKAFRSRYLSRIIIGFLRSRRITVYAYRGDRFWGIDKNLFGIKEIR